MISTYIINLRKDCLRREYISSLLENCKFLKFRFVDAVYGKMLSEDQIKNRFDLAKSYKRYGRYLNPGEIGCTLSHFKCYRELLKSDSPYVLLLEDDISIINDFSHVEQIVKHLPDNQPWVLFLSADYWFTSLKKLNDQLSLAKVYDAVGTYAYVINRVGAKLLLEKNPLPSSVADNWSLYRRQGLHLYAVKPYMIDANIESFDSSIEQQYFGEIRKNMPLKIRLQSYWLSAIKKLLLRRGNFVSKIRK